MINWYNGGVLNPEWSSMGYYFTRFERDGMLFSIATFAAFSRASISIIEPNLVYTQNQPKDFSILDYPYEKDWKDIQYAYTFQKDISSMVRKNPENIVMYFDESEYMGDGPYLDIIEKAFNEWYESRTQFLAIVAQEHPNATV